MSPVIWYVIFEDVVLLAVIFALIYTKKRIYTLIAFINLGVLIIVTALFLYGNHNWLLAIAPGIVFIIMNLVARPFIPQNYKSSNTQLARIIVYILFSLMLVLIIIGVLLSIFIFAKKA